MSLFFPSHPESLPEKPRVFALPPGVDFAQALVDGLAARMGAAPPEDWARLTLWVNTRRTARRVETLLMARGPGLLPQLRVLGDLAHMPDASLPTAPDALHRQLTLAALVSAYQSQRGQLLAPSVLLDLAQSLGDLLEDLEGEGLDPTALDRIDSSALPKHWDDNLAFLGILRRYLASLARPYSGAEGRRAAMVHKLAAAWQTNPPSAPVLVAGSTGSRRATRNFMAAVARLPQGAVILPGFDDVLPTPARAALSADHPQFALNETLVALGAEPGDVILWHNRLAPVPERGALISLALRPAPVTDDWLRDGPALIPSLTNATQGLTLIEADSQRHEAQSIALALRRALDLGQTAALVTPDRTLARRVANQLRRWDIAADDSAGQPLHLTPPGLFLRLLADVEGQDIAPVALLELLKHPLTGGDGAQRGAHLGHVQALEMALLRGGPPQLSPAILHRWASEDPARHAWLAPLLDLIFNEDAATLPLSIWAAQLQARAGQLCPPAADSPQPRIWDKDAGQAALSLLEHLTQAGQGAMPQPPRLWAALMTRQMQQVEVRPPAYLPHPNLSIWGPLEARVQSADLLILGGLTEGGWPQRLSEDHWLNRQMRKTIGLPLPELRIGLAAHDFQTALGAPNVILSRALRDGEAETLPSRWLLRLVNLLQGLGAPGKDALADMQARGAALSLLAQRLDRPIIDVEPAKRPSPAPPLAARPNRLSVTQIETLIRDPYAVYARHILRLKPLNPLGRQPDALERGTVLHAVLADLVRKLPHKVPATLSPAMRARMDEILTELAPWPAIRAQWRARLLGAMAWFLAEEADRRNSAAPIGLEAKGALSFDIAGREFTLSAAADRIDRSPDGHIALYDYKSGSHPTQIEVDTIAIQLPLEALIAEAGGFNDIAAGAVETFAYILLGAQKSFGPSPKFTLGDGLRDAFTTFLAAYADPARGYPARARHDLQNFDGDYDHLSRLGEWDESMSPETEVLE